MSVGALELASGNGGVHMDTLDDPFEEELFCIPKRGQRNAVSFIQVMMAIQAMKLVRLNLLNCSV